MIKDFETSLDELLGSYGLQKKADIVADLPATTNVYHDSTGTEASRKAKQPITPSANSVKGLPEGQGRLEANGSSGTAIGRALGGMTLTASMKAIRQFSKSNSLNQLGLRKEAFRFMPFTSSPDLDNEKLIGFLWSAIETKYAGQKYNPELRTKLANDPLVQQFIKRASAQNSVRQALGESTLGSVMDVVEDLLPAASVALKAAMGRKLITETDPYSRLAPYNKPFIGRGGILQA